MGRKPFRFMGRDPVSKIINADPNLRAPVDTSKWRHAPDVDGRPKCGAPVDEKPASVNIQQICSECMKVIYEALYGGKRRG